MYNLHSHSLLSDGALLPSEVAMRYMACGYKAVAITDHADYSNIEAVLKAILEFCRRWPKNLPLKVLPGIELTHLPTGQFQPLAKYARKIGAKIIIGHGETPVEPVVKGTNRAALEADIDILAHPGLISDSDVRLAKKKNIFLEVTSRLGHSDSNAHVVERAKAIGAKLILSTDSHEPQDIITPAQLIQAGRKSGLSPKEIDRIFQDIAEFLKKKTYYNK
jgi:histidinol phosphatase-like PHP family hydrolase